MKATNSYSVCFYQRNDKSDKMNTAPVYMRVTVNGKRAEIATNKRFDVGRWHSGEPAGNKTDARELRKDLESFRLRVNTIYRDLTDRGIAVTADRIKEVFTGKNQKSKNLLDVFKLHNDKLQDLVGTEYSPGTLQRYQTTLSHVREFINKQYGKNDLLLQELNFEFVSGFDHFLRTVHECSHNTAVKYVKNLRKIINMAINYDWLEKDPFSKFQGRVKPVERCFLSMEELRMLEEKKFSIARIEQVRDIFIFCCYTGLAYADVEKLSTEHIVKGIDGSLWIMINRTKTDTKSRIPLLQKAAEILDKYEHHPVRQKGALLPVLTNQRMNSYLKELADVCGITKNLTFHIARHTFATTVTLTNGVPIETVSAMLGHRDIHTTQIYAKVIEQKVGSDMAALREKLA